VIKGRYQLPDPVFSAAGTGNVLTFADRYEDRELLATILTLEIV